MFYPCKPATWRMPTECLRRILRGINHMDNKTLGGGGGFIGEEAQAEAAVKSGTPFPCLYSPISTENLQNITNENILSNQPVFTNGRKKSAYILAQSVEKLAKQHGLNFLGFLTLTFSDHVTCPKEAQKRLNSLFSHVIKPRYGEYVGVFERQKSGRIHYHLLVTLHEDIRSNIDFEGFKNRDYRSASKYLRGEWKFWRDTARKYRFGRTELMPIKSSSEAIKYYVGKYISKSINADTDHQDKGVKLVRYSKGARAGNNSFSFLSEGGKRWRQGVAFFSELVADYFQQSVNNIDDLTLLLGKRWAYKYREYIIGIADTLDSINTGELKIKRSNLKQHFNFAMAKKCIDRG